METDMHNVCIKMRGPLQVIMTDDEGGLKHH